MYFLPTTPSYVSQVCGVSVRRVMIYGEGDSEGCVGIGDQRWRSNWVCRLYRGREKISVKEMCV